MKKKSLLVLSLVIEGLILLTLVLLPIFINMPILLVVGLITLDVALMALSILFLVKTIKKEKIKLQSKSVKLTGDLMIDIYEILGIPVQYNPDGSIKSIYELLKINPIYDETGTRILTPYELLGMMPSFDMKGNEIPTVFVIKNRVKQIAKVDLNKRVLTRKLTEKELEQRMIEKALKEKLKEAVEKNDGKSAAVIIKKIEENKKAKADSAKKEKVKFTRNNKFNKIKPPEDKSDKKKDKKTLDSLFRPKSKPAPKPEEPETGNSSKPDNVEAEKKAKSLYFSSGRGKKTLGIEAKDDESAEPIAFV